jgi:hypothetical protein
MRWTLATTAFSITGRGPWPTYCGFYWRMWPFTYDGGEIHLVIPDIDDLWLGAGGMPDRTQPRAELSSPMEAQVNSGD